MTRLTKKFDNFAEAAAEDTKIQRLKTELLSFDFENLTFVVVVVVVDSSLIQKASL